MKRLSVIVPLKAILPALLVTIAIALAGCSKKTPPTAGASAETAPTATPAAPPASVVDIAPSTDITKSFAEADAAIKAKAYDKAVQQLLAVQHQKALTQQQAQEARSRMVGLQGALAAAVANGDPNAVAAAEMLRRSAMVR